MKKITFYAILILSLFLCVSCQEKMTCDNPEGVYMIKENVTSDIIESYALHFAADDYDGFRYGFFESMYDDYETYLLEKLGEIKNKEGQYYQLAVEQFNADNEIKLYNIIAEKYDETTDKCECSARIVFINSNTENDIKYDLVRDTEGNITGRYIYNPKVMLDEYTNTKTFINKHKDKF